MDFENLKKNPLVWFCLAVFAFNASFFMLSTVMVEKATTRVIERLQKEYSPGPNGYGPKLDPDKVHPDALKSQRAVMKLDYTEGTENTAVRMVPWQDEWENQRH